LRDNNASELKERMSFRVSTTESESVAVREKYDVVYSNASLHWSLHHEVLLPNIIHNLVKHDGVLAIQMPDTRWQASHLLMIRAAENCGVYDKVKDVRIPRVEETPEWLALLYPIFVTLKVGSVTKLSFLL
jgi:trans-aconitate methyltransferase